MAVKYLVCNTVAMQATHVGGKLVSAELGVEVPNGQFVYVGGNKEGEREIRTAVLPTDELITTKVPMLVMKPEINPSQASKADGALGIFRNPANKPVPVLPLFQDDEVELSQDFFGTKVPAVGETFKLKANSYELVKFDATPAEEGAQAGDKVYFEVTEVRDAFGGTVLLNNFSVFPVAHKLVTVRIHLA